MIPGEIPANTPPFTLRKFLPIAGTLCAILLGLIFLYSGYTKLLPLIETFEFTFVDLGAGNWYTAPVIARLLIGLEFFLGLLLILNYRLRKFTIPFAIILLIIFIAYLGGQIWLHGNTGNCGCFGEHLKMTPLEAILKNIVMIGGCLLVFYTQEGWKTRFDGVLTGMFFITSLGLPFILNPIDYTYTSNNLDEKVNYRLELDLLYSPEDTGKVEIPRKELRQGRQVLAFLSLSCPHCRVAAKKFMLIKKNNPDIPVYFILNGDRDKYPEFIADTRADNVPYSFCLGKTFVQLSSAHLPRIYYLDNSIVVKKVDYFELNQYEIEHWLQTGNFE